jgi:hypothetical protein
MNSDKENCRALVKRHARWRYVRWLKFLGGVLSLGSGTLLLCEAHKRASAAEIWDEEAVLLYPMGITLVALGLMLSVVVLATWRGDPIAALLLTVLRKTEGAGGDKQRKGTQEGCEHS